MDSAVTTGIFTAATAAGGTLLGYGLSTLNQRSASRSAIRQQAQALFVQAARAIVTIQGEIGVFKARRDSRRANLLAAGTAILHAIAGRAEGNLAKGAAAGVGALVAWDAGESARFTGRYQLARTEASAALIQLSLLSPALQEAVGDVSDALAVIGTTRNKQDAETAERQLNQGIARLRTAVAAHGHRKWWWQRGKRSRPSIEAIAPATGQPSGAIAKGRARRQLR
jgi:hypothetical protein